MNDTHHPLDLLLKYHCILSIILSCTLHSANKIELANVRFLSLSVVDMEGHRELLLSFFSLFLFLFLSFLSFRKDPDPSTTAEKTRS